MKQRILLIIAALMYAGIAVAQQDAIIHESFHGEQAESRMFNFDQDSTSGDVLIQTRIGDHLGTPAFVVTTGGPLNDHGWSFYLRSNYGDSIPGINDWSDYHYHEYKTQGAIHEGFHTALRKELSDGSYCYGWISYRVDAGDETQWYDPEIGIITFYEYYYCTIPNYPFHVGQTSLEWTDVTENVTDIVLYRLYPNPVEDVLRVEYSPDVTPEAVELYDVQGHLVHTQNSNFENIGMENLPAGTYTLHILLEDGKAYSEKVLKAH